jgi:hypothetical protein
MQRLSSSQACAQLSEFGSAKVANAPDEALAVDANEATIEAAKSVREIIVTPRPDLG